GAEQSASGASDPLAELARLIGQSDPFGEYRRRNAQTAAPDPHWESDPAQSADGAFHDGHAPGGYSQDGYAQDGQSYDSQAYDGMQPYGDDADGYRAPPVEDRPPYAPSAAQNYHQPDYQEQDYRGQAYPASGYSASGYPASGPAYSGGD